MKSLLEFFENLSWGWPREWEELAIIIILGFLLTIVYRTSKIFIKLTIGLTIVGLVVLLIYSFIQGKNSDNFSEIKPGIAFEDTGQNSE